MIPDVTIRSPRPDFTITAGVTAAARAVINFGGGGKILLRFRAKSARFESARDSQPA